MTRESSTAPRHAAWALSLRSSEFDNESGVCVFIRPDGDQAYLAYRAAGTLGGTTKGTLMYIGGTGKLAGLPGGGEFTRTPGRPTSPETFHATNKTKATYRLP